MNVPEKELWWCLDTRRFGTVKHAASATGLEHFVQFVTGMGNIRGTWVPVSAHAEERGVLSHASSLLPRHVHHVRTHHEGDPDLGGSSCVR